MGYQALLFCPDEKLARVVSQVFSELDFTVDAVTEPFTAVKKLMAQRYDAVVIDCDNEQNSSLLIKSGRTSVPNQGSLAIAMVEGQAGVARAYRIGANLVLTKPINVEQTKGTLRVARGLLRKNLEAATAASAAQPPAPAPVATAAPTPVARPVEPANRIHEVVAPPPRLDRAPEFEAPVPAMSAPPKPEPKPVPAPQNPMPAVAQAPAAPAPPASSHVAEKEITITDAPKSAAVPVFHSTIRSQTAASAPAPAKEIAAPASKPAEKEKQDELFATESAAQVPATSSTGAMSVSDAPSFAALDNENAGGSGSKKILIAAAAVLVVAVGGYFGWTKFGQGHSTPAAQPVAAVSPTPTAPAPDLAPAPVPAPVSSAPTTNRAPATVPVAAPKTPSTSLNPQPAGPSSSSSPQKAMLQPEAKITASAPLVVKSASAKNLSQPDVSSAPPPSPLAVASPNDSALGGLLTSASSNVARPSLATIKVSQGVSQGMVIKRVQPKYPPNALSAHIQGAVQIEATVNKEGIVVNPKVLSGDATLAAAALQAVRQWRYKPYYLDGEPVEIQTQITINFKTNQ